MSQTNFSPVPAVGAVVCKNNQLLLVRRAMPPAQNQWAIPGGKIQLGESIFEAACRELREETGILANAKRVIYVFDFDQVDSRQHWHYRIVDVLMDYAGGALRSASDASEARWFSYAQIVELHTLETNSKRFIENFSHQLFKDG
jgi:ADP-ribose pyrophosphatase YjhB (NUDIX family)